MKPVKKFFVYKCKLSLALLHLANMFTNKLKTRLTVFFTEWFKIQKEFTTPFEEISQEEPFRSFRANIIIVDRKK